MDPLNPELAAFQMSQIAFAKANGIHISDCYKPNDLFEDLSVITYPPLTRLPPELLALVFEGLESEELTLCVMSRKRWRLLIIRLWPKLKTPSHYLLRWAANVGSLSLMYLAKERSKITFDISVNLDNSWYAGCDDTFRDDFEWQFGISLEDDIYEPPVKVADNFYTFLNVAIGNAAKGGHLECLKLAKKWGATDFNYPLNVAAANGHIHCMWSARKWLTNSSSTAGRGFCLDTAFRGAAEGGHINCMKLLKEWGAPVCKWALHDAVKGGQIASMKLVKEWSRLCTADLDNALSIATRMGHTDCIKMLKEWGATTEENVLFPSTLKLLPLTNVSTYTGWQQPPWAGHMKPGPGPYAN